RRIGQRAAHVHLPVAEADDAAAAAVLRPATGLRAGRALLRARLAHLRQPAVVDDGDGVALASVRRAIDLGWQVVAVLRNPGRVVDLRLAGEVHLEAVLGELEVVPGFLRQN